MQTWIFQGNPDQFDLDGYFADGPDEFCWLVTRYKNEIQIGDKVFLWRSKGKGKAPSGIIAEAVVVGRPEPREETEAERRYWREENGKGTGTAIRALLRLTRVANKREALQSDWLKEDPILRDLPNLKMAAGTNYLLTADQAARLASLWTRIGLDWTRADAVAGLWAYIETLNGPVSKLPGSPVAIVSTRINRPISGVYNKVMNFRALDPRDPRKGFSGAGEMSAQVWNEFYDTALNEPRAAAIAEEFERLWHPGAPMIDLSGTVETPSEKVEAAAQQLEKDSLEDLMARYRGVRRTRPHRPATEPVITRVFERDPLVVAIARKRAGHRCEVPGCTHATFETQDGSFYVEVHHIRSLADGGEDTIENVAAVCASHHREAHLGKDRDGLTAKLEGIRREAPGQLEGARGTA